MAVTPEDIAECEDVDFEEVKEYWNVYKLKDGTTLKVKLVLIGVKRLEKHNPDGSPIYVIQSQNIYVIQSQNIVRAVDVPKELYAKPKPPTMKPV